MALTKKERLEVVTDLIAEIEKKLSARKIEIESLSKKSWSFEAVKELEFKKDQLESALGKLRVAYDVLKGEKK